MNRALTFHRDRRQRFQTSLGGGFSLASLRCHRSRRDAFLRGIPLRQSVLPREVFALRRSGHPGRDVRLQDWPQKQIRGEGRPSGFERLWGYREILPTAEDQDFVDLLWA